MDGWKKMVGVREEHVEWLEAGHKEFRLLNTLEELLPLEEVQKSLKEELGQDKYVIVARWLRMGESEGALTPAEHSDLRAWMVRYYL